MPISLAAGAPTLMLRREAFERAGLTRASIDAALTLTDEEFRVERDLIAIGPIYADDGLTALIAAFEAAGLEYFDDFFELSGNWPEWLSLYSASRGA
jgi:hypothetical protein